MNPSIKKRDETCPPQLSSAASPVQISVSIILDVKTVSSLQRREKSVEFLILAKGYSLGRQVVKKVVWHVFWEFHRQLGWTAAAMLPKQAWELLENMLQNLLLNLPPQTVGLLSVEDVWNTGLRQRTCGDQRHTFSSARPKTHKHHLYVFI